MSSQDELIVIGHQDIKQVVDWLFPAHIFASIAVRSGARWRARMVAVAALVWALSDKATLGLRFDAARRIVKKIFRWQLAPGTTYQGFIKMLRKWHTTLLLAIEAHVRVQMKEVLPNCWEIAGYVVFAGDGSRIELARTESLENAFSPARRKSKGTPGAKKGKGSGKSSKKQNAQSSIAKKQNSPQMWLTLMWHVGTGLPWTWRTGPSDSSERAHLLQMLSELPENSLITADAGFVGYEFWSSVLEANHNFVIRVGSNVKLLRKLGYAREYDHTVYLWPNKMAKKQPPLVLRLIVVHNGKHPIYLVTNLSKSQLTDKQAATIYSARWGIELFFRTFKQTLGVHKLHSRSPENATMELDWSLLGLWCVAFLGQRELAESGQRPETLSAAAAIRAFQDLLNNYRTSPETVEDSVWYKLRNAILDEYQRKTAKTSRTYPRKKQRDRMRPPKITRATKQQVDAAQDFKNNHSEYWLTA